MKICSKCHIEKDESGFNYQSRSKDLLQRWCKQCQKISSSKNYNNNVNHHKERVKRYYLINREQILTKCRVRLKNNPVLFKQKWKKDYLKNRSNKITKVKQWQKNNPEKYKRNLYKTLKKQRDKLSNRYIKLILVQNEGVPKGIVSIYPQLIELKRLEIKTKRLLKNQNL